MMMAQQQAGAAEGQEADENLAPMGPAPVNRLEEMGIPAADIKKLAENGYHTVESVAYTTSRALRAIKGITDNKIEKLFVAARQIVPTGFTTATCVELKRRDVVMISTGSTQLDSILAGACLRNVLCKYSQHIQIIDTDERCTSPHRRHRDGFNHRNLRRVSHWQNAAVPPSRRGLPGETTGDDPCPFMVCL